MCCVVCVQCALHTPMTIGLLRDGTMGRIAQMQKECGIAWRYNSFWDWPFASKAGVYDAIGFDRLHVCKGLILKCVDNLNGIILEEGPGGDQANNTQLMNMQAKLDHRIANTPAYLGDDVYVPTLTGGFYARTKVCELPAWPVFCPAVWLHNGFSPPSDGIMALLSLAVPHKLLRRG